MKKTVSIAISLLLWAPALAADPPGSAASADPNACYTAVYDQQTTDGTYAHYGKGEWDADRQLCIHVKNFTRSFLPNVNAIKAAQDNPFIHVMYVIDRTNARFYAPCGANVKSSQVPEGVIPPGTYDLNTFTQVDSKTPSLGAGADCLITG